MRNDDDQEAYNYNKGPNYNDEETNNDDGKAYDYNGKTDYYIKCINNNVDGWADYNEPDDDGAPDYYDGGTEFYNEYPDDYPTDDDYNASGAVDYYDGESGAGSRITYVPGWGFYVRRWN